MREFVVAREVERDARDREIAQALVAEAFHRAKDPASVAKQLQHPRGERPRRQTVKEAKAVISLLAARYGWKGRPVKSQTH